MNQAGKHTPDLLIVISYQAAGILYGYETTPMNLHHEEVSVEMKRRRAACRMYIVDGLFIIVFQVIRYNMIRFNTLVD